MQNPEFTPGEDFDKEVAAFEQWLAQDQLSTQHVDMSDDDLRLLSEDDKIALIKSLYAHISKQQETIDWYEGDDDESGEE